MTRRPKYTEQQRLDKQSSQGGYNCSRCGRPVPQFDESCSFCTSIVGGLRDAQARGLNVGKLLDARQ